LTGPVTLDRLPQRLARLVVVPDAVILDLSGGTALDTAGAWLIPL
jgi:hypothetical protein